VGVLVVGLLGAVVKGHSQGDEGRGKEKEGGIDYGRWQ